MKKIFLALTAALLVAGTAFAGTSQNFEAGVAFGNISCVNKNNSQNHVDYAGWGFTVGCYEPLVSIVGFQGNLFMTFPGSEGISVTTNGNTVKNTSGYGTVPLVFSAEAMLAVKVPLSIFYVSAGAGIGYTLFDIQYPVTGEYVYHQLSVPVFAAVGVNFGSFGVKAGCDIQFVFTEYVSHNDKTDASNRTSNYNLINVFPYVAATFNF